MAHFQDDRPRKHHYAFEHRELLGAARRLAGNLPGLVRSGQINGALGQTWERLGGRLPPEDRLPSTGLSAALHLSDE